jgi:small-conductance mechanosensitive channel
MEVIRNFLTHGFWAYEFFGNTVGDYAVTIILFFVFLGLFKVFQKVILLNLNKFAERTATDIDDTFIKIVGSMKPPFYFFLAFYLSVKFLELVPVAGNVFDAVLIIWIVYQVIAAVEILIDYIVRRKLTKGKTDKGAESAAQIIGMISKIVLWALGLLMILSNIGVDVTSLIAGLGIGGIAVALAAQNILGDLFSSFAIYFDKPFKVGDFVVVGGQSGTVKKVGIKTTRIQALQGEEIVMSNKELTTATIQNFKKLKKRRISFSFGVTYETEGKLLKKIPSMIETIITKVEGIDFVRAHFTEFADSALLFEVIYTVDSSDYGVYRDKQQEINFAIKDIFEKKGISMAYPTQTLYVEQIKKK